VISQGARLVVLSQPGAGDAAVARVLSAQLPEAAVGVGLERPGLDGARVSVGDAERALALAVDDPVVVFGAAWPWALVARELDRVRPLVEGAVRTARDHGHLAEAVLAYADTGSIADTGRRLGVHANTVTYRLDRWAELTGWDARGFEGLLRSVIALRLAR
jgi:sugar diacid utilization regulator